MKLFYWNICVIQKYYKKNTPVDQLPFYWITVHTDAYVLGVHLGIKMYTF